MQQPEKSMEAYYAARAGEYDRVYARPEYQKDLRLMEKLIPETLSGRRVLEIACGTGYWTQFFAPKSKHVVATDITQETLDIARHRVRENVEFHIADAYALPETYGRFNAAFAGHWLSHVRRSRIRDFFLNLHRVLEPGSTVLMIDNLYVEGSSSPITEHDAEGNTYQTRKLLDGSLHRVLKNFPSDSELTEAIEGLGRKHVYRTFDYFWMFEYEAISC